MNTKVQFVDLTVLKHSIPLAFGYMHAYACIDKHIADSHSFDYISEPLTTPRRVLIDKLSGTDASIYAFSCYVWNMGLIRALVDYLVQSRPNATIILGGPQIIGHAYKYLKPAQENIYVCNGEGETVFLEFLQAMQAKADMKDVPGLTFYRDGKLITTAPAPMIENLNSIPSPFLNNIFTGAYAYTVLETNRGCPYQCTFCYWGRGDDLTVRRFDEQRVRDEIQWLAQRKTLAVHIGDANWGLLARDVDFTKFIVECKDRLGYPAMVNFSGAKDKPQRSADIAKLLTDAGIIASQAIGIQSTTDKVLVKIKRRNIKLTLLQEVREKLDEKGVSIYTELIWPLPGETLSSFKESINNLCKSGVATIVAYASLLLHTTPMEAQAEELGIKTRRTFGEIDETELIVATNEVSESDYEEGFWVIFGLFALYNCCALRHVGRYLHDQGIVTWSELFHAFGKHCRQNNSAVIRIWRKMLLERRQSEFAVLGRLVHELLHAERASFMSELWAFVEAQPWWRNEDVRILFELDLLDCPYIYSNTPMMTWRENSGAQALKHLECSVSPPRQAIVNVPPAKTSLIAHNLFNGNANGMTAEKYRVNYKGRQFPYMPSKSVEDNAAYCHAMIEQLVSIAPQWSPV